MEKTPSGLVQRAFVAGNEVDKKTMDITLGSGRQGQTYLFWQDSTLFQLPVSYHAPSDGWSNSPGYPRTRYFLTGAFLHDVWNVIAHISKLEKQFWQ